MLGTAVNPLVGISALVGRSGLISNYLQNKRMQKQMMSDQRRNEINQIQQRLDNQNISSRDDYMGGGGIPTPTAAPKESYSAPQQKSGAGGLHDY